MKKIFLIVTPLLILIVFASAQNSSPYWSLTGNSNATSASKLGTTNAINLGLYTNNTERMRVTTGGNVGIGTTSPLTKFQVNGFGSFGNRVTTANATRALNLADDNAVMRVLRVDASNAPAVELISRKSADGANVAYWDFYARPADASFRIRDRQSGGAGIDRITISHGSGNVGIGTTSPAYKLDVESSGSAVYGNSTSGGFGVYGNSTYLGVYGSGTDYGIYGNGNTSTGTGAFGAGYYGVYGSGTYGVYGNGASYGVYGATTSGYGIYGTSTNSTAIYGSGYFGVYGRGNNTGVYGTGSSYGLSGYSSGGYGVYGYSYSNIAGYFYSSTGNALWAQTASTSTNVYAGVFQGSVYTYNSYVTSDKNLKKNIKEFSDAMSIINKLKPKNYEFRNDGKYASLQLPAGNHYGLLAQDLEEVLPGLVRDAPLRINSNTNNDVKKQEVSATVNGAATGVAADQSPNQQQASPEILDTKAVNYTELIPIVIKGMQELSKENESLRNEVDQLKTLVQTLTKGGSAVSLNSSAFIKQNAPNPLNDNTVISYFTPNDTRNAQILFTDIKGSLLRTYTISNGEGQLNIRRSELPSGTYNYTLYVNNNKIDTKQMIIK